MRRKKERLKEREKQAGIKEVWREGKRKMGFMKVYVRAPQ